MEARRQAEIDERRAEQRRREDEALRKLQEKTTKSPWAQAPRTLTPATHTASLAEIQRLEREKKAVH